MTIARQCGFFDRVILVFTLGLSDNYRKCFRLLRNIFCMPVLSFYLTFNLTCQFLSCLTTKKRTIRTGSWGGSTRADTQCFGDQTICVHEKWNDLLDWEQQARKSIEGHASSSLFYIEVHETCLVSKQHSNTWKFL